MGQALNDDQITQMLNKAKAFREQGQTLYKEALELAAVYGWSNIRIARTLGVSETAVRAYRKRHGL